jgi:protein-arginine kinase activator protein McsA
MLASILKTSISQASQLVAQISHLETLKAKAVERESYDEAAGIKIQIQEIVIKLKQIQAA